jgi:hypothetical protein
MASSIKFTLDNTRESKIKIRDYVKNIVKVDCVNIERYKRVEYIIDNEWDTTDNDRKEKLKSYKLELNHITDLNRILIYSPEGWLLYEDTPILYALRLYNTLNAELRNDQIDKILS